VKLPWQQRAPAPVPPCPERERVREACTVLGALQAGGHTDVPIRLVLEQLDPDGRYTEPRDPRADPVTGCLPVDPAAYSPESPS
jgi:hypothetical protein